MFFYKSVCIKYILEKYMFFFFGQYYIFSIFWKYTQSISYKYLKLNNLKKCYGIYTYL